MINILIVDFDWTFDQVASPEWLTVKFKSSSYWVAGVISDTSIGLRVMEEPMWWQQSPQIIKAKLWGF